MGRLSALLHRRQVLVDSLSRYPLALAGNLSKSQVPPRTGKYYWRLTWKDKQKTKIQYVRQDDVAKAREGVRQFAALRNTILKLGQVNRAIVVLQSRSRHSAAR
jgi:hypothetical protein